MLYIINTVSLFIDNYVKYIFKNLEKKMLDYRFVKENIDAVKANILNRCMTNCDADKVVQLFDKRTSLITQQQELQSKRNQNAAAMKKPLPADERDELVKQGKLIKTQLAEVTATLESVEIELEKEGKRLPNMTSPDSPVGKTDADNKVLKVVGDIPKFDFQVRDHVEIMEGLGLVDFERATKVSGPKFYYLKGKAVMLEQALIQYALNILMKHNFELFITPDVAKTSVLEGIGFNPRGAESNVYTLEGEPLALVATAEITLGGYHSGEVIDCDKLPLLYGGLSHCFRREAGAAGQWSRGLYRVHQFDKVEMFAYSTQEQSGELHKKLRTIEEEIFTGLGLPFRVIETCTGDLGAPAYRKWDLEAWMPARNGGEFGEVTSTSNCTDYQARRLNIKYRDKETGKSKFVHTLNGTAIAVGRAMLAIMENYQRADGSVGVPKVLQHFCGFDEIK